MLDRMLAFTAVFSMFWTVNVWYDAGCFTSVYAGLYLCPDCLGILYVCRFLETRIWPGVANGSLGWNGSGWPSICDTDYTKI